jgi:hypothetical protein
VILVLRWLVLEQGGDLAWELLLLMSALMDEELGLAPQLHGPARALLASHQMEFP